MNYFKPILIKIHWLLVSQLGFDPIRFIHSLRGLPIFLQEWAAFRSRYSGKMNIMPCLHDRFEEGGATTSEYFWQDLIVARAIHDSKPQKHVDIGSRVDGFVAHVACFRECEVFDIRNISTKIPGVVFRKADLMDQATLPVAIDGGYCDSLSCLHAIEHFGLGRYGDQINPEGYRLGMANMAKLLKPLGTFYLATPIGQERVEFNAHRVFDPRTLIRCAKDNGLSLSSLSVVRGGKGPSSVSLNEESLQALAACSYSLGLFVFTKILVEG